MNSRNLLLIPLLLIAAVLAAGCTDNSGPGTATQSPTTPVPTPQVTVSVNATYPVPAQITTVPELVAFVADAAASAREDGREKAVAAFNDPKGAFVSGNVHIFAIQYDGTLLADALEPGIVGTNIWNMTDSFGTPLVQNMAETARFGRGYVTYTYPNPGQNYTVEPETTVVEDIDGTYFIAAGMYGAESNVNNPVIVNKTAIQPDVDDLVTYVNGAVAYARANGKVRSLAVFSDPKGPFIVGDLVITAFDVNGTTLASPPYAPELMKYHINLINYQDRDGVETIRGLRDVAREGGGFYYSLSKVTVNGKKVYVPIINYVEPVDGNWWISSGIVVPEYAHILTGNLTGIQARDNTREALYDLVTRAVSFAKANAKEKTFAEINDPHGQFVTGDLFVWAESSNGTILADPFFKSGIGRNQIDYVDRYGMRTTRVGIEAMKNGTGFSHALFPNTAINGTMDVPKLIYMKAVDDTWWIGSGVYGIEVQ